MECQRRSAVRKLWIYAGTSLVLYLLSFSSLLVNVSLLVLAVPVTGIISFLIWHNQPREFLRDLSDKAVLVTGCDTGFGNSLARKLDSRGVTVYAGCLFPEGAGALDLKKSCSNRLKILPLDVTRSDHVEAAVRTVKESLGDKRLWAIVNNAGIGVTTELEWCPIEIFQKTMEVNAIGPVRIIQAFLPLLRKSRGRIVTVASYLGRMSVPASIAYNMSKHAAITLNDTLRRELIKWSITVHSVEPWLYRTDLTNEDTVMKLIDKCWGQLPQEVQVEYGDKYIEDYKSAVKKCLSLGRPTSATEEVSDDMLHATIGKNPKANYIPGVQGQLHTWFSAYLPQEANDFLYYKIYPRIK